MPRTGGLDIAREKARRPLAYLVAGGINTLFGLSLYPLMLWASPTLRIHYLVALGMCQLICVVFAFASYKIAVFRTRGNVVAEFVTFVSFYLLSYAINWLALPVLVEAVGLGPVVAQTGFTLIAVVASYLWHSRLTFAPAKADTTKA